MTPTIEEEIKTITIDGETYRFAPLTMLQIEQFVDSPEAPLDYKESRERTWCTIHASLANAAHGGPVITLDELKSKITLKGYLALHGKALEASYLRDPDPV